MATDTQSSTPPTPFLNAIREARLRSTRPNFGLYLLPITPEMIDGVMREMHLDEIITPDDIRIQQHVAADPMRVEVTNALHGLYEAAKFDGTLTNQQMSFNVSLIMRILQHLKTDIASLGALEQVLEHLYVQNPQEFADANPFVEQFTNGIIYRLEDEQRKSERQSMVWNRPYNTESFKTTGLDKKEIPGRILTQALESMDVKDQIFTPDTDYVVFWANRMPRSLQKIQEKQNILEPEARQKLAAEIAQDLNDTLDSLRTKRSYSDIQEYADALQKGKPQSYAHAKPLFEAHENLAARWLTQQKSTGLSSVA